MVDEAAIVVAFRKHTLLPLDVRLYALQATIPKPAGTPTNIAQLYTYTPNVSVVNPRYKVVSLLYSPPGKKSTNGFSNTTTSGTTTTVSNSFASGKQVIFNEGFLERVWLC